MIDTTILVFLNILISFIYLLYYNRAFTFYNHSFIKSQTLKSRLRDAKRVDHDLSRPGSTL